jgi:choline dehydrogenase
MQNAAHRDNKQPGEFEYIVVGSGAGGGTVAARLAEAGKRVLVLEAGSDPRTSKGGSPLQPDDNRMPEDYDVPVFHAFASENDAMKWDFFVRHYTDDEMQSRDPKYYREYNGNPTDGVLYPRAGTLGGCTAHNAMIFVAPHNQDWDDIAELTGDSSWRAENMRRYFQKVERCRYRPLLRWLAKIGIDPTRHGWNGWLDTEDALPLSALRDSTLMRVVFESACDAFRRGGHQLDRARWAVEGLFDPNDWRLVRENSVGIRLIPLSTRSHARIGTRERLLEVQERYPDHLKIELNALATKVLLDDSKRAVGVEYLKGERLYRASATCAAGAGELRQARASREVILSGGAFNTPQLLMLSGIGHADALRKLGIQTQVHLPGVGKRLQDRYEVGVVNRMRFKEWEVFDGAAFRRGDPLFQQWEKRRGVYTSNGIALSLFKYSRPDPAIKLPDLFLMGVLGFFKGYYPNYSKEFGDKRNYLTWTILKAHTRNRAGEVSLRSPDPRDMPRVDFRYFEGEGGEDDLNAVVEGIKFARQISAEVKLHGHIEAEEVPGAELVDDDALREHVRNNAWGHHASCTCAIGPREADGVLDNNFRVHGTAGLRVVDASIFPKIPGFFVVASIYTAAEKAADVILHA